MSSLEHKYSATIFLTGGAAIITIGITLAYLIGMAVNAKAEEQGYASPAGHSEFHQFYFGLYNSKKSVSCCHNQDCRPTQLRDNGNHMEVMLNGQWRGVKEDEIIPKTAPDWGAHVCAGDPTSADPLGRVYCVIVPPRS